MEIVIIVLLVILIGLLLWYILRGQRRWQEQSDALTRMVGERVEGGIGVFGEVRERLGELTKSARSIEEIGKNISSLQEILRAPKPRGGLGEILLERLLSDSLPVDYYKLQHRFKNGEAVDAVVIVGGNLVPIDAKFPLESFERMISTESEEEQVNQRRQFTRTVKKHIENVSKYILPDENTFDFALMYVPAENIYYETICQSEIYTSCIQNRVFLVSPNSFNAYLQAIALGLRGLRIQNTAREILGRLSRLQNDFSSFQRDYETLGGHIQHAYTKYDDGARKLTRLGDKLQLAGETPVEQLSETDKGDEEGVESG